MAGRLRAIGWRVLPSVTNFLLVRPPDASATAGALQRRGMVVRSYASAPLAGWLRVTVRDPGANARLLAAVEEPA
jgi:histidinol-phosphate aminotransferase